MDSFFAIAQRLSFGALLVLVCALVPSGEARAATYDQAHQSCMNYVAGTGLSCINHADILSWCSSNWDGRYGGCWPYDAVPPPAKPCANAPHATRWQQGKFLNGYQATITWTDPASGVTVQCRMHMNPLTPPMMATDGSWWTMIGVGPDDSGASDAAPLPSGEVTDQNGAPAPQVPNNFPSDGSGLTSSDPPKVCGGVSCYNPKTGTACGLVNGVQICVQGPPTPAQNGGGCAVMGDGSLCNGNPPPTPDPTKVPDPPTWTKGIDRNTFADPSTGNSYNNITIVYGPPSQSASSGQQLGDMGPPSSSSTAPKPQSGYGDGGDCNSPPSCTGDAVMCGIARETWRNRCSAKQSADQAHKDLTGNGPPQDFDQLKTKYGQGDVWTDNPGQGDGGVGDAANQGNYDQSGFGYSRQCPLKDITVSAGRVGTFTIRLADLCVVGDWVRGLVIAMALYAAFCITRGASMKGVG